MNKQLSLIRANANRDACSINNLSNLLSAASCLLPIASASATTSKSNYNLNSQNKGEQINCFINII